MWAVIDVETTGRYWKSQDRVIEIAVVRLDPGGRKVDTWSTLLNPNRDLGPTNIHGITMRDVRGAPTFDQVAEELLWRLGGHIPVGHNVRFDLGFLTNEYGRLGVDFSPVQGVCTMEIADRMGAGRSLEACCAAFGVPLDEHHTALADAEATGRLLEQMAAIGGWEYPQPLPQWRPPARVAPTRNRTDPPLPRVPQGVANLASRIGVPNGGSVEHGAAVAYLNMLDRVLEDRIIDADECESLAAVAQEWGISKEEIGRLNRAYIEETWALAESDGVVTKAESCDIQMLAEMLAVPTTRDASARSLARERRSTVDDFSGKTVCFTGTTQAHINGRKLGKSDLKAYAEDAGMVVKDNVSRTLDILVAADPDTQSGKGKTAAELGVRVIYDVAFLRALGIDCDAGGGDA